MAYKDQPKRYTPGPGHPGNTGSTHGSADTKALLTTGPPKKANYQEKNGVYLHRTTSKKKKIPSIRKSRAWIPIVNLCLAKGMDSQGNYTLNAWSNI